MPKSPKTPKAQNALDRIASELREATGRMSRTEREVLQSVEARQLITSQVAADDAEIPETRWDRLADNIARFGGSWGFIISFFAFIFGWMLVNLANFIWVPTWDPYPFILLNLCLSCLAAIQAPVILMSQNREEIRDRRRAENDYKINLKAEIEIRELHEKMDKILELLAKKK